MKTMCFPCQQEGAILVGLDEGVLGKRIVILAHRLSCDDASREYDACVAFVGCLRKIQKGVFSSA